MFLPPQLKDITELKKITLSSILFSALYLIISVAVVLFLFDTEVSNTLLMPLYSAVRYIEFGTFFQRLDSVFILAWIISFVSYLSITINTCCNILKKVTSINSVKFSTSLVSFFILIATFFSTTYAVSTFFTEVVYKYCFFIIFAISLAVIFIATLFKSSKRKQLNNADIRTNALRGGA